MAWLLVGIAFQCANPVTATMAANVHLGFAIIHFLLYSILESSIDIKRQSFLTFALTSLHRSHAIGKHVCRIVLCFSGNLKVGLSNVRTSSDTIFRFCEPQVENGKAVEKDS